MKKNNIKTKVIATALSAITVLSVGAMTTTTAFAAETHLSAGTTLTDDLKVSLDRDLKYATKITSETILKVLSEAVLVRHQYVSACEKFALACCGVFTV